MDGNSQSNTLEYFCQCSDIYLAKKDIKDHLKLPKLHKINKVIHISTPKPKFIKSALIQIQTLIQTQALIQESSIRLIQTISKNTEIALKNINYIIEMYKTAIIIESDLKNIYKSDLKSIFITKPSLNTEIVSHFDQRFLDEEPKSYYKIKSIKKQAFKVIKDYSFNLRCVAISSDENLIATGDECGIIKLWDVNKRIQVFQFAKHRSAVNSIAFDKEAKFMLSGSEDCSVRYYDTQSHKHLFKFKGHFNSVYSVIFSKDNQFGYSCGGDRTIIIWNLLKLSKENKISLSSSAYSIKFLNKSDIMVAGRWNGSLMFWNLIEKKPINIVKGNDSRVSCMCFSEDEKIGIIGYFNGFIRVYNIEDYANIFTSENINKTILSVDISVDSKNFVYCTSSKYVISDLTNFNVLISIDYGGTYFKSIIYSKLSLNLVFLTDNNQLIYKSLSSGHEEIRLDLINSSTFFNVAISRDLKYMAYCNLKLSLLNLEDKKIVSEIVQESIISRLQFSSNSAYLVTSLAVVRIEVYEVPSLIKIKSFEIGPHCFKGVSISNDGNFVPYITDKNKLQILFTKDETKVLEDQNFKVTDIAFCSDDEIFIFLDSESSIHILNKNFTELKVVKIEQKIHSILISEDREFVLFRNLQQKWAILNLKTYENIDCNKPRKDIKKLYSGIINHRCLVSMKLPELRKLN